MLSDYNSERTNHYDKVKSIVITPVVGNLTLLTVALVGSFFGLFTDMSLWFMLLMMLLSFLTIIYIFSAIGIYRNFHVFKQIISVNNIMDDSNDVIIDFLEKRKSTAYRMLGIYETDEVIIIEFSPYRLKHNCDKYVPIIALMPKVGSRSGWQNIEQSEDTLARLSALKQFAKKNEESKLRYLGNQVYYFSHLKEDV
ncbi:hypothetical protein KII95_07930 [Leuconostoc gelidum subsp. aenigmaticum]|uniref:hypothetical protein n=1 Tax=Leuconostoc gelidum TaxID=1244 RepID=UPI001CC48306|nr:hypothetical protein [Leuconostoc gelidum]MBZ6003941.1 hypothetical protein [Leuconostoc gelidum subsp. aenigmaticum]